MLDKTIYPLISRKVLGIQLSVSLIFNRIFYTISLQTIYFEEPSSDKSRAWCSSDSDVQSVCDNLSHPTSLFPHQPSLFTSQHEPQLQPSANPPHHHPLLIPPQGPHLQAAASPPHQPSLLPYPQGRHGKPCSQQRHAYYIFLVCLIMLLEHTHRCQKMMSCSCFSIRE